jgi:hypothetical protein
MPDKYPSAARPGIFLDNARPMPDECLGPVFLYDDTSIMPFERSNPVFLYDDTSIMPPKTKGVREGHIDCSFL